MRFPGVGRIGAQELIAEVGVEMSRFPSAAHLVSWAKFAPTTKASAGKTRVQRHRQGHSLDRCRHRRGRDGSRQDHDLLGARYRRVVRRRDTKCALVAVGNSIPSIAYCLLSDPQVRFADLGADFHDRLYPKAEPVN